ncbi:MAG: Gfo/Idh/MocA family oxidoreductase [Lentisphaeraceae bacterium]|nr:Gfo/Idh/MocA family oxidoreductase [Lentisphaeraceae bacterium]
MGKLRHAHIEELGGQVIQICDTVYQDIPNFTLEAIDVISNPLIDAIIIGTPNYKIKDLVIAALQHGKHVFAEKPPGVSLLEVNEMKMVAQKYPDLKVKFGFNHRYHQPVMMAKERISGGDYGDILWMRGRYGKSVDKDFKASWRSKKELAGGGILLDQGIHMLDLMLYFIDDFDEVKAFCQKQYWGLDIEDNVFAMFRNPKGQTASLHSTMTQWSNLFSLEIFLERGYMTLNGLLTSTGSYTENGKENITISSQRSAAPLALNNELEKYEFDTDGSFQMEIKEFIQSIQKDSPIKIGTLSDALKLMGLIEKIYADGEAKV